MGLAKHHKSGHPVNSTHFTGRKSLCGPQVRRKGKRGLTRKQRKARRGTHINKYQ